MFLLEQVVNGLVLGGYYLFEAESLDDAIAVAAQIPGAASGAVEVRPLVEH